MLIRILLISLVFQHAAASSFNRCGRMFPLVLGGKNKDNGGNQLAYHEGAG